MACLPHACARCLARWRRRRLLALHYLKAVVAAASRCSVHLGNWTDADACVWY